MMFQVQFRIPLLVLTLCLLATFSTLSLSSLYYRSNDAASNLIEEIVTLPTATVVSSESSTSLLPLAQPNIEAIDDDDNINNNNNNSNGLHLSRNYSNTYQYPDENAPIKLPKILVLYFPQYHQDPLNDRLWGKGFTDWDNLRDAPLTNREGYKVIRPTNTFGYYDLRNTTIRKMQGQLAQNYGVDGFVYHHYWFYDEKYPGPSLHAPLSDMLQDGHPNLPFCLHWVAENWTTTWHRKRDNETHHHGKRQTGNEDQMLQQQFFPTNTSDARITAHYQWLRQFFHHKNYIKVQGKPILMLYRRAPGVHLVMSRLKELAIRDGFPGLFLTLGQYVTNKDLFPLGRNKGMNETLEGDNAIFDRLTSYPFPYDWTKRRSFRVPPWCVNRETTIAEPPRKEVIGVVTSFDNTPRREFDQARIWMAKNTGIEARLSTFRGSLRAALFYQACCYTEGGTDQFLLINAWNEWAEGMALEPSDVYGLRFLEGLKKMKGQVNSCRSP